MKVLFTVQGEGRGHLTQAIAMKEILEQRGHEVVGVLVGSNGTRSLPSYFAEAFPVPVRHLTSPGFAFRDARGVATGASLWGVLRDLPACLRSLGQVRRVLRDTTPDLVINFLEPIMGLHNLLSGARVPTLVVGHHYMPDHPGFIRVPEFRAQQRLMRFYTALVGARSTRLALSFYPAPDVPQLRLHVCPPLLRQRLYELEPARGDYLLIYLLNHGYAEAVRRWHLLHPHIPLHCFYDRPGAPVEERITSRLVFHQLHGDKFLKLMAGARAVACTAGFESVSEAAYLGKPVLMIPVENHVEQHLNACDAEHAGLGWRDRGFQLARLLAPGLPPDPAPVRRWMNRAGTIAMHTIERVVGIQPAPPHSQPVECLSGEPVV